MAFLYGFVFEDSGLLHFLTAGTAELAVQRIGCAAVRTELCSCRGICVVFLAVAGHFCVVEFRLFRCRCFHRCSRLVGALLQCRFLLLFLDGGVGENADERKDHAVSGGDQCCQNCGLYQRRESLFREEQGIRHMERLNQKQGHAAACQYQ